jgi:phospholipid/cholesterol/gamma-HCH transport system ATP-binding protein
MIRFENVSCGPLVGLSFDLQAGETGKILISTETARQALGAVLFGLVPPARGKVTLLDQAVFALAEDDRIALFRRVGVVPANGGLISNLKVWENILLPAAYHMGRTALESEAQIVGVFRQLGYSNADIMSLMGKLPDELSMPERRLVALVRAMLTPADLMIYDDLFSGLTRDLATPLLKVTGDFHEARRGRTSLYLCPDDAFAERIRADQTIKLD